MTAQPEYIRPADVLKAARAGASMAREAADDVMIEEALGSGITVALDPIRARDVFKLLLSRKAITDAYPRLAGEWLKVAMGLSNIELPAKDVFYGDKVWHNNALFRRLAQGHLALTQVFEDITRQATDEWTDEERAAFVSAIVTGALSPANFIPTNPVVLREAIDTRGKSLAKGLKNFLTDFNENKGMPSMVDASAYQVGENLAITPGKVIYREEIFELIHYEAQTDEVHSRPLLFVPPQVNKYYVLDLAPGRSMVEYAIQQGLNTFMLVWRNPRMDPKLGHGNWGLEDYIPALLRAVEIVKEVTGSDDLNTVGLCAGGMSSALAQSHLTAEGDTSIAHATYIVTMLDARKRNMVTGLSTEDTHSAMVKRSEKGRVLSSKAMGATFAWMRPKDLVFNYVINNWLLGKSSPAFDVLAWNCDGTNVSTTFFRDLNETLNSHAFVEPGRKKLMGRPIDMQSVDSDAFIVAGQRDHITTWRPCYMSSQLLGGESEIVIVNSGHIQTFVNPIKGSRYKYWTGTNGNPNPDAWLEEAEQVDGSWWPKWSEWVTSRSGPKRKAPKTVGSAAYQPIDNAPGAYVHET